MASKRSVTHLLTLADLSPSQITRILTHARYLKQSSLPWLAPHSRTSRDAGSPFITPGQVLEQDKTRRLPSQSLFLKTIALLFSKRSTRTRLAAETAASLLGGKALFLGREDIQMGVNESIRDSARVIGGMTQGIFARVGEHDEIEELAKYSPVPVLNALSSLWHPTQVLADLLTLHEHAHMFDPTETTAQIPDDYQLMYHRMRSFVPLPKLRPLTIAYVGDSANVLHDMLVTYPRLGHRLRVATPDHDRYRAPKAVWERVEQLGCHTGITWVVDPKEAVKGADLVVTDTWISMGQEAEKAERLRAFQGYQVTERLCREGGANPDWKFMHCLPRKQHEVDDEVFYGSRSLVFPEADNRKWTIMALFDLLFGKHDLVPILPNSDPSRKPSRTAPPVKRAPEAAEPAEVQN